MSKKVKIFESRTADGLEKLINEFGEKNNILQISYHRREPIINPNTMAAANQSLHCCMVMYGDEVVVSSSNCDSCCNYDPIDIDTGADLMDLDTDD